jgi:predicted DNA-binding transcriptional regulator YafY
MPRNAEVVRQWKILLELEASRRGTINGLAGKCGVTTRTIRRDLDALQEDHVSHDRRVLGQSHVLDAHPARDCVSVHLVCPRSCQSQIENGTFFG